MTFPRERIARIERNIGGSEVDRPAAGAVRDEWYLLRSGGMIVGARHLVLKHVRSDGAAGWRLEEQIEHFPRGPQVPAARSRSGPSASTSRFARWRSTSARSARPRSTPPARDATSASSAGPSVRACGRCSSTRPAGRSGGACRVPADGRARLGTREHLLRRREVGLQRVELDRRVDSVGHERAGRLYGARRRRRDGAPVRRVRLGGGGGAARRPATASARSSTSRSPRA